MGHLLPSLKTDWIGCPPIIAWRRSLYGRSQPLLVAVAQLDERAEESASSVLAAAFTRFQKMQTSHSASSKASQFGSSSTVGAIITPVTTSVAAPTHTDGGVIVPCNYFWFFDICPKWDDISIFGWFIKTPNGVHPPGPPPPIQPGASISVSIPTPLPDWPEWT